MPHVISPSSLILIVKSVPVRMVCPFYSVEETKRHMQEALGLHLAGLRKDGQAVPEPVSSAEYIDAQPLSDEEIFCVQEAKGAREKMNLSQPQFAKLLGVPVATLRNWE